MIALVFFNPSVNTPARCQGAGERKQKNVSQLAILEVQLAVSRIIVHITVANPSNVNPLFLEKKKIIAAPPVRTDLFRVMCEGTEVPYIGPLAKVKQLGPDDFFRVNPLGKITGYADIAPLYEFRAGDHLYTIEYHAFHSDPKDETKLLEITSAPIDFRMVYKPT